MASIAPNKRQTASMKAALCIHLHVFGMWVIRNVVSLELTQGAASDGQSALPH
jgi:hypothetical protein